MPETTTVPTFWLYFACILLLVFPVITAIYIVQFKLKMRRYRKAGIAWKNKLIKMARAELRLKSSSLKTAYRKEVEKTNHFWKWLTYKQAQVFCDLLTRRKVTN